MPKISDLEYVSEIDATSYLLGVKGGATVRFPASILQGETPDAPTSLPVGGALGQVLTKNSATDGDAGWADSLKSFISLPDTPSSYTGKAGKFVKVNAGATGLEFSDVPTGESSGGSSTATKVFTYTHLYGGL